VTRSEEPVLRIDALSRRFGEREPVHDVTVAIDAGERLALRGPNGSGKTTLIRCVTGALLPTRGTVAICGREAGTLDARRSLGAASAEPRSFAPGLTGRDSLRFAASLRVPGRRAAQREAEALVEELELDEIAARQLDDCSTGMLQQVAFAHALVGDPRLLVLDEPTRSLDDDAVERVWAALDRRRAAALLIASHSEDDVRRCSAVYDLARA
jgi:ABC-2 type transport system ATP-binding protein